MSNKRKTKFVVSFSLVLTLLLSLGVSAVGVYAAPKAESNNAHASGKDSFFGDEWDDFDAAFSDDTKFSAPDLSNVKLINTKQWDVNGIVEIEVTYVTDEVRLLQSSTKEIVLKEYLSEDSAEYHAITSMKNSKLKIDRGERPAPSSTGYISYIEIHVPANFNGIVKLRTESGNIDVTNYKGKIDCLTSTGLITVSDSNICGSLKSNNGIIELGIDNIIGNLDAHSDTGDIVANISKSVSFKIQAETKTGATTNSFSDSLTTSDRFITGKCGTNVTNKISLSSNSGNIEIAQK